MSDDINNEEKGKKDNQTDNQREKNRFPFSIKKDKEDIKLKLKESIDKLADKFSWKQFITRLVTNKKFLVGLAVVILAGIILIPQLNDLTSQSEPPASEADRSQDEVVTYEHIPADQEIKGDEQKQPTIAEEKQESDLKTEVEANKEESEKENREELSEEKAESEPVVQQANIKPKFNLPVKGAEVSRSYGWSKHPMLEDWRYHQGVDLQTAQGTPIRAATAGKIAKIKEDDYLGLVLIIEHKSGHQTIYGHAQEFNLKEGQQVNRGQTIGKVGTSGLVMEPTLHFGIIKDGESVDPTEHLNL
ncbi:M23 family metallopeptidase [Acetohalobium arabaticum]|uniref:Peptidase M23 n=1 Tax=Acetohalobium arabaticum (strain ATCC 49924 / DSM 5501 / Z-7288) TaxID=574087 RepID=D9QTX6_ACEAZ|nr:M23 family metallopeptidase [Acetohalobium arabaticum]ADL13697.1 Peptidase M23 [Acetohalobium arabaticum DSM 5501]